MSDGEFEIRIRKKKDKIKKSEDNESESQPETKVKRAKPMKIRIKVKKYDPNDEVDQSWSLYDIATKAPPKGWEELFELVEEDIKNIDDIFEERGGDYLPYKKDIFNAYRWCPLSKVKVVIVGQDPYHTVLKTGPQAVGAAFSIKKDCKLQPSIKNMYEVLSKTVEGFEIPTRETTLSNGNTGRVAHGDLRGWAKQGVLLLNTCLTVEPGAAGSHSKRNPWKRLIRETFRFISEKRPDTVVFLWGSHAQKYVGGLREAGKLKLLETSHPSGLSAYRGFMDCNHFNEANEYLKERGHRPINWSKL